MLAKYVSPERKAYDQQFKDSEGYYTTFFFHHKAHVIYTKLISLDKAPKSYEDLLDPRWKGGKLALEGAGGGASGIRWFICVMKKWSDDYERYEKKFKEIFSS